MAVLKNTHALMAETRAGLRNFEFQLNSCLPLSVCGSQHIVSILSERKLAKLVISCLGFACNKLGSSKEIIYIRISQYILVSSLGGWL